MPTKTKTLSITNFDARLTRKSDGDINSGMAKYDTTHGVDPFSSPGNLTWFEKPIQIDSGGSVITDTIMAAKTRLEGAQTFVYAIGNTANAPRLYKIQVNDTTGNDPNYDTPTLVASVTAQSPSYAFGSSMQFYGATEQIYIGGSQGVNKVNFNGTGDTFVGSTSSYITASTGVSAVFLGKLYYANGTNSTNPPNLVEIDSTGTVTSYNRLSPALPAGTYIRDLRVTPDGNYLQIITSSVITPQINFFPQEGLQANSALSYVFYWNGIDEGVTSYNIYYGNSIGAAGNFGNNAYLMGQDLEGANIYNQNQRSVSLPKIQGPINNATFSSGNMLEFMAPESPSSSSVLQAALIAYGQHDREAQEGLYRLMRASATTVNNIVKIPVCLPVTNNTYGESGSGYTNNLTGTAKIYYSTYENSVPSSLFSRFYKFTTVPTGLGSVMTGVYETQTQIFSKKVRVSEVRIYGEPWVANNSFKVDLIGSSNSSIIGGSYTFEVGNSSTLTAGQDYAWYNPATAPTYALGLKISNTGSANHVINKVEIEYDSAGK